MDFLQRILVILFALLLAGTVQALPALEWRFPSFPLRTVFHVPEGGTTNVLLTLKRVGNMPVIQNGFLACGPDGTPLPLRVVQAEGDQVVLTLEAPRYGGRPCAVYYGSSPSNEPVTSPKAAMDPAPLAVGFKSLQGRAIPTSWERLKQMLLSSPGQIRTPFRVAGFNEIGQALTLSETDNDPKRMKESRRYKPGIKVAWVRSVLLCPLAGTFRFAVDCLDGGFVTVDGELVAAWPGEHEPGAWQLGTPVFLKAGVHRVEVFNVFDGGQPNLRVGWLPPGRNDVSPLAAPDLVASCEVTGTRAERMDRTLHPGFIATPVQAYSFRGNSAEFIAVRFNNITENWITTELESRWQFGDGTKSSEKNPVHVYKAADVFKASLEVRDALGFVAGCSETVDCRQIPPEECAVSFDLSGLPAVCFSRDRVAPSLRIQGVVPTNVVFEVSWEFRLRSGVSGQAQREITPRIQSQFIQLATQTAGELESLNWSVSHRQARLWGERIRFMRPPFEALPSRIEGDRLCATGGTRLVLVPDEGVSSVRQAAPVPVHRLGRLVCADDSLAVSGLIEPRGEPFDHILARLLTGRMEEVRYAALPEWGLFPESYGSLRKLVDVPAALHREQADVAILSIGLQDILEVKDVDSFERQAAALSDMLAMSMNMRTVWVTPPPYPSAPERSRVFAAAIRRVAEARGIPVADLFTAFSCASDSRHVFFQENPLMLSDLGHRLAGQQIARALMGE